VRGERGSVILSEAKDRSMRRPNMDLLMNVALGGPGIRSG
jgi:hypothetical protein